MNIDKSGKRYWSPVTDNTRKTTSKGNWYNHYPWQNKVDKNNRIIQLGMRAKKIQLNPFCEDCILDGTYTMTQQVDHIKPINQSNPYDTEGGKFGEFLDIRNLRSLCKRHHDIKSAKQRSKK